LQQNLSKDQAIATFARLLRESNKSEVMVFVHGFNERYDDTVYGFAQILHDSGALGEVAPVLFTGPRKGMSSPTATTAKARIILAIL